MEQSAEHYSMFVAVVIFGWLPVVLLIFSWLPPRRAVTVSFVAAWLFLPMAFYKVQGLPTYDKMTATCCGVLLAAVIFDTKRMANLSFCPSYVDIPILIWCLCPLATAASASNQPDLTIHDGISWTFMQFATAGLPYLIGRIYFSNREALRELTVAVFIGGLIYVPLCIWEIRMSPQLHYMLYGFHQHSVAQQVRGSTFRPMVFMEHGLAVGMYMISASIAGMMLWKMQALRRLWGYSVGWLLLPLIGTTILCRSMGATVLMILGTLLLWICIQTRTSIALCLLLLCPTAYVMARTVFDWDPHSTSALITNVSADREQSLDYRLENEDHINQRVESHDVWFGWGGYARPYIVETEEGKQIFTPDSLWIIAFGTWGATGLAALLLMTAPILILLCRLPARAWRDPSMAGVLAFCALLGLFQIDNMLNDMPNPIFLLGLGGLCGLAAGKIAPSGTSVQRRNDHVSQSRYRSAGAIDPLSAATRSI